MLSQLPPSRCSNFALLSISKCSFPCFCCLEFASWKSNQNSNSHRLTLVLNIFIREHRYDGNIIECWCIFKPDEQLVKNPTEDIEYTDAW